MRERPCWSCALKERSQCPSRVNIQSRPAALSDPGRRALRRPRGHARRHSSLSSATRHRGGRTRQGHPHSDGSPQKPCRCRAATAVEASGEKRPAKPGSQRRQRDSREIRLKAIGIAQRKTVCRFSLDPQAACGPTSSTGSTLGVPGRHRNCRRSIAAMKAERSPPRR